jgi:uncharacterized BrkB/YihY/UPF0761 family membrane protein
LLSSRSELEPSSPRSRGKLCKNSAPNYLAHELKGASATYGLFGIVLGLLAWIYLAALIVVFCAELNVVRAKHLWPRSLLTPSPTMSS